MLRWGTHGRSTDIMDTYAEMAWRKLCEEITKLRVTRRVTARVIPLRAAASLATPLATVSAESLEEKGKKSGGAGNRTRVRKTSSDWSHARLPE